MMCNRIEKASIVFMFFMLFVFICNAVYGIAKNEAATFGVRDAYIDMKMESEGQ